MTCCTIILNYDEATAPEREAGLEKAAAIIRRGGLVAFPTETVYGLGADALNPEAVGQIFTVKGRPADNPLIVHVADLDQAAALTTGWDDRAERLAAAFWPGPLTLVLPRADGFPDITTAGLSTVGLRLPGHPVARALISQAERPIAAPSANLSGGPSPTRAEHVIADLNDKVPMIITAGDCRVGIESTVLDLTLETPEILRPGFVTAGAIFEKTGIRVTMDPALNTARQNYAESGWKPKAPGMKYRHYAPKAEVIVLRGPAERIGPEMKRLCQIETAAGKQVVEWRLNELSPEKAAFELFDRLRRADLEGADIILAGTVSQTDGDLSFAVMNRLLKSAGYHVIDL